MNTYQQQLSNEVRSSSDAYSRALHSYLSNITGGSEFNTSYGKKAIEVLCPVIEQYLLDLVDRRGQHHNHFWYKVLRPVLMTTSDSASKVADIVALNVVSRLSKQPTFTSVIRNIADALHNYLDLSFEEREEHLEQTMKFFMGVIQHIEKETDVLVLSNPDNDGYRVVATSQWTGLMDDALHSVNAFNSIYAPMVCEPIDHTSLHSEEGGYLITRSPLLKKKVKVKGTTPTTLFNADVNPAFFDEINKVQRTPYCVNTTVLTIIKEAYEKGMYFSSFPNTIEQKMDVITDAHIKAVDAQNKLNAYYAEREGIDFKEVGPKGSRKILNEVSKEWEEAVRKTNDILTQAEFFAGYDKLWFPVYVDSRGRRYTYVPSSNLTYMGTELAKALLVFADKKALTKQGVRQLFYTLGNTLGFDKKNLKVKGGAAVRWFNKHKAAFLNNDYSIFFKECDAFEEPINALTIVVELMSYKKDSSYLSGYIAHRDARCSGASIIGTLLNDEKAMTLTSVIDSDSVALPDAYLEAANTGYELNTNPYFFENKDVLFKRSVWKTPTMTYSSYGATRSTIHSGREGQGGNKQVFEEAGLSIDNLNAFTNLMMEALDTTLPSCKDYRDTIKNVSANFIKENDGWFFVSPLTGFPVVRRKTKVIEKELESPGTFNRIRLIIKRNTTELDTRKALTATPPDLIHHIDAAILMMVGQKVGDAFPIATIHDSIGAHPNDVPVVVKTYAEVMYELATSDVLDNIFNQLGGTAPAKMPISEDKLLSIKNSKHILV